MDAATIGRWVSSLGLSHAELIARGERIETPTDKIYDEFDWLTVIVEPGLMLDFWEDSLALEKVLIELMPLEQGRSFYRGELPAPFSRSMTHADIRNLLGTPLRSGERRPSADGQYTLNAWESYRLPEHLHPGARVGFVYSADRQIKVLSFDLLEPQRD
ncbi:DUF6392 family protein [Pseudomonas protegens]|jgi:hypothetical protein|uniref:DUF6392 family protein n=1 Tax=Pseudomonas protegens TaxID=380021 RepID=UPI0015763223|nr:DUF6392 family protein [Pseudomonas protegens]MDK1398802.1 DUF6392 family protein [Pseudomonas protegens]MDS9876072.1 DUF6392 family protein [Pseudomonas protegens]NTZ73744.1 pyocin immunity protein [Pseudomonas protegens]